MHIKKCVGLTVFDREATLKLVLTFSKFDNLRNLSCLYGEITLRFWRESVICTENQKFIRNLCLPSAKEYENCIPFLSAIVLARANPSPVDPSFFAP